MTNDKKDGGEGQKRPHATLDLKATDVTPPEQKSDANVGASKPGDSKADASAKASGSATASSTTQANASAKAGDAKSADAKTGPTKESAAKPASARSGSSVGRLVSHLLAGVAGGALALAIGDWAAPQLGISTPSAQLQKRADELQKRLSTVEQAAAGDLAGKLKTAEARLAKLEGDTAAAVSSQIKIADETKAISAKLAGDALSDTAQQRMSVLEERLATIAKAAETDKGVPQITALTAKIADLQTSLATQVGQLRANVQSDVESRTGLLSEKVEQASSTSQRLDKEFTEAKTEMARLAQRLEVLKASADKVAASQRVLQEDSAKLTSGFDEVKSAVASQVKGGVGEAVTPLNTRLSSLEDELDKVTKSEADRRQNAERVVVSLELANLKRQIDAGGPFGEGLEQVRKSSSTPLNLASLERYKDSGVPTLADLQRDFRPVANAMVDAAETPAEGGVIDKLMAGAKSIVRVRNTNPAADDKSVEAVVSRMQEAMAQGRLGDVLTFAKELPQAVTVPAHDWLGKAEARHSVDRAIGEIETQLKSSLTAADAGPAAAPTPTPAPSPAPEAAPEPRLPAPGSAVAPSGEQH